MSERHQLDARYLLCPLPVIRAQNKVAELRPGDILEVRCTDRGALSDIPAWCRINGHEVIGTDTSSDEITITLRVSSS